MFGNQQKKIKEKLLSEFGNLKVDSFDFEYIDSYFFIPSLIICTQWIVQV